MKRYTVNEYAREIKKTPSSVYQNIKKGLLKVEEIDGKTFIVIDNFVNEKRQEEKKSNEDFLNQEIKYLKEIVKLKDNEIESLKASLNIFSTLLNRQIPMTTDAEIVEIKRETKKKKKKRK
jgi:hypothetical protein